MGRIIGAVYNGLIWAALVTLLCVNSVVICMHINMGTLFAVSFVFSGIVLWTAAFIKKWRIGAAFSLANLAISTLAVILVYRLVYQKDLLTRPAFILRLALHRQEISEEFVNAVVLAVIVLGCLAVLLADRMGKKIEAEKKLLCLGGRSGFSLHGFREMVSYLSKGIAPRTRIYQEEM